MKTKKLLSKILICISCFMVVCIWNACNNCISYADPNSSAGYATYTDEQAHKEAVEAIQEQEKENKQSQTTEAETETKNENENENEAENEAENESNNETIVTDEKVENTNDREMQQAELHEEEKNDNIIRDKIIIGVIALVIIAIIIIIAKKIGSVK